MVDRLAPCSRSLAPYLTTFGVVLSINSLSLAQPRFASPQAQGVIMSNVQQSTACCASVGKREGATRKSPSERTTREGYTATVLAS
jgi:hypothetical protein